MGQRSTALQQVFKAVLNTRNVACTHSALLGLGLAHPHAPMLVEQIITEFLSVKGARLPKELFVFAKAARKGKI